MNIKRFGDPDEGGSLVVKNYDKKVSIEFDYNDVSLDDWLHAFYTAMVGITFLPESVLTGMKEFAEENLPEEKEEVEL